MGIDADSNALGSMNSRYYQWQGIFEYLSIHTETLLFGLGTGRYGDVLLSEDDPMVGTHNMFFDVLMEAGLFALIPLVILIVLMIFLTFNKNFTMRNRLAIISTFILVMLMTREHSVAYLYATSLGGFCFSIIFYIINHKNIVILNTNTL
jgi:hypothetical protein